MIKNGIDNLEIQMITIIGISLMLAAIFVHKSVCVFFELF